MQLPSDTGTFHIIGIGGIGMSAIAEILVAKGFTVQGSDQKEGSNVRRLRNRGVTVFVGHDGKNLMGARNVVISSAVKAANPELMAARAQGLTVIRRAEMLAELMRLYRTVSVTGTHGKTTTTSLLSHIFAASQLDPTVITGGIINAWGSNARLGQGQGVGQGVGVGVGEHNASPWMIVEADESDGTFTRLPTEIGIVTNIDPEHLDHFKTVEAMHREYDAFARAIPFYGLLVACIDHPVVRDMLTRLDLRRDGRRLLTYGRSADADLRLTGLRVEGATTIFDATLGARVAGGPRRLTGWQVPLPGEHNGLNALAAIAVATEAGLDDHAIMAALGQFSGVKRRFQLTGSWNGVAIYDDYAHHPVEIAAVLKAARAGSRGRLIAIVEPHRYSRVSDLFADFCGCFKDADSVIVGPLYSAGEAPIPGIDSAALADGVRATGHARVTTADSPADLVPLIASEAKPGDSVVCLGAGNSTEWANALSGWLETADAAAPRRASAS